VQAARKQSVSGKLATHVRKQIEDWIGKNHTCKIRFQASNPDRERKVAKCLLMGSLRTALMS